MLTTTHFGSAKYRPLSRAVTYASQMQEWPPVLAHRLRNLACHLVAVAMVFAITAHLGGPPEVAFVGAALFGVSPMAHQTVAAAIFTIDFAYALTLVALVLFLRAYESARHTTALLAAAMIASVAAAFTYEATVAVFGCFAGYLLMKWARGEDAAIGRRRFLARFAIASVVAYAPFVALRSLFVAGHMPLVAPATIVSNLALFSGSLALPVDLLLLNSLWKTPLPSDLVHDHRALLALGGTLVVATVLAVAWLLREPAFRRRVRSIRWLPILYVVAGIPLALAPFLLFTDHPSETYLYLPAAFFAVAWSLCLDGLVRRRGYFLAVASVMLLLAASGTWMRTERVRACGLVAARVLRNLPLDHWRSGARNVVLADAPGIPEMRRFGLYGYRGLGTIDPREPGVRAIEAALRLETRNPALKAEVVAPDDLPAACPGTDFCAWVYDDGRVVDARRSARANAD